MVSWEGRSPVLSLPATVGVAWRLEELGPDIEDPDGFLSDREYYEGGWRRCLCYSTWQPEGERGYVPTVNLVPLQPTELRVEEPQAAMRAPVRGTRPLACPPNWA